MGAGDKVKERKIAALSRPALGCALACQKKQNWEYSQVPLSEEAGSPTAGHGSLPGLPPPAPQCLQPNRLEESPRCNPCLCPAAQQRG